MQHVTRYIHLNPEDYLGWDWSSFNFYLGYRQADWVHPELVIDIDNTGQYLQFVEDYEGYKKSLEHIDTYLAHT